MNHRCEPVNHMPGGYRYSCCGERAHVLITLPNIGEVHGCANHIPAHCGDMSDCH
jgi:hypothetical protein